jgi:hypothetical protein
VVACWPVETQLRWSDIYSKSAAVEASRSLPTDLGMPLLQSTVHPIKGTGQHARTPSPSS